LGRAHDQRARTAERERDLAAREAVVDERARIARELHDVIAHNVSMMVLQAGAERRVLPSANGPTRDVLQTIEVIGRSALTEMRRLLGMRERVALNGGRLDASRRRDAAASGRGAHGHPHARARRDRG
jgi:signal transduction histidine kinase